MMTGSDISLSLAQTNNPRKIQVLEELGVDVRGRIPCIVESQELNVGYLATKQVRPNLAKSYLLSMPEAVPRPAVSSCSSQ